MKILLVEDGQSIELEYYDYEKEERIYINKVEIAALTDQLPMGVHPTWVGGLNLIISENALQQLLDEKENIQVMGTYMYLNSSDPLKTQQVINNKRDPFRSPFILYKSRKNDEQMMLIMSVFTYGFIVLITLISIANIFNTISTSISLRKREFAMLKSVGMTPKGFNKMINYESIFYGIKSLLYGLPISILVMYLIHRSMMNSFSYDFSLPWTSIIIVVITVFVIVGSSMLYSSAKVKKENIIDALKQENI